MSEAKQEKHDLMIKPVFGFRDVFGDGFKVAREGESYRISGTLKEGFVPGGQEYTIKAKKVTVDTLEGPVNVMEVEQMIIDGSDKLGKGFNKIWFYNLPPGERDERLTTSGFSGLVKEAMEDQYGVFYGNTESGRVLIIPRFRSSDSIAALYHEAGHDVASKTLADEEEKRRRLESLENIREATGLPATEEEKLLAEWYGQVEVQASVAAIKMVISDRKNGINLFKGDEELVRLKNMYTLFAISQTRKYPEIKDRLNAMFNNEIANFDIKCDND